MQIDEVLSGFAGRTELSVVVWEKDGLQSLALRTYLTARGFDVVVAGHFADLDHIGRTDTVDAAIIGFGPVEARRHSASIDRLARESLLPVILLTTVDHEPSSDSGNGIHRIPKPYSFDKCRKLLTVIDKMRGGQVKHLRGGKTTTLMF